jgi:hypothetical protein
VNSFRLTAVGQNLHLKVQPVAGTASQDMRHLGIEVPGLPSLSSMQMATTSWASDTFLKRPPAVFAV